MPYYSKPRSNKPVKWFYAVVILIAVGVLYWSYVLHPVAAEVTALPQTLQPDGKSFTEIRIILLNRLDTEIPGHHTTLKCEIIEGRDLVSIEYNNDKTVARVIAKDREGIVEISVSSPELVLPQTVRIYIELPRA